MQITIDLTEEELARLDEIGADRKVSRNELLRSALTAYLMALPTKRDPDEDRRVLREYVGIWKDMQEDGLDYQQRLRSEW